MEEEGWTKEERDFIGSVRSLCKRYNVSIKWLPINDPDENGFVDMDYFFTSDDGILNLAMAQIVYGEID